MVECNSNTLVEESSGFIRSVLNSFYRLRPCGDNEVPLPNLETYNPVEEFVISQSYHTDPKDDSLLIAFYMKTTHGDYNAVSIAENKWSISYIPNGLSKEEREKLPYLKKEDLNKSDGIKKPLLNKTDMVLLKALDEDYIRGAQHKGVPRKMMLPESIKSKTNEILNDLRDAIIDDSNQSLLAGDLGDWLDDMLGDYTDTNIINLDQCGVDLYKSLLNNGWTPPFRN